MGGEADYRAEFLIEGRDGSDNDGDVSVLTRLDSSVWRGRRLLTEGGESRADRMVLVR